jgi:Predicted periplasmic/secreted protein
MIVNLFKTTPRNKRHYGLAVFLGVITGIISAFVKSGTEEILPPRTPDRIAPPVQMLNDMGIDWHKLVYSYSEQLVYWGGNAIHIIFSIVAAIIYCVIAEVFQKVTMLQGIIFGILFAFICHGIALPVLGLSPNLSQLPLDEIVSEVLGTCLWIWTIELLRTAIRCRMYEAKLTNH